MFGGNNNNQASTSYNRSNRPVHHETFGTSGLQHTQHSFSTMGLTGIGKNNDAENFHHLSPESNGIKSLLSPRMGTGRGEGDNIESMSSMVKEEPEFYETVCHWVGCDRGDLQTQDALVKVMAYIYYLNSTNQSVVVH